ncbi:hypothetical protein EI94DRAFT_1706829 [Lactarius quietus]|nr:hypothetical protein EI94DRAFT_1706829 [Lactarius quietus]
MFRHHEIYEEFLKAGQETKSNQFCIVICWLGSEVRRQPKQAVESCSHGCHQPSFKWPMAPVPDFCRMAAQPTALAQLCSPTLLQQVTYTVIQSHATQNGVLGWLEDVRRIDPRTQYEQRCHIGFPWIPQLVPLLVPSQRPNLTIAPFTDFQPLE